MGGIEEEIYDVNNKYWKMKETLGEKNENTN